MSTTTSDKLKLKSNIVMFSHISLNNFDNFFNFISNRLIFFFINKFVHKKLLSPYLPFDVLHQITIVYYEKGVLSISLCNYYLTNFYIIKA